MPISKYFKGHGEEVMSKMKKQYGSKKGKSVFYATANKKSMHGSGVFSSTEQKQGYQVVCGASELHKMEVDTMQGVEGYTLADRRDAFKGSFAKRKTLRRSESSKGSY
jgi:hypothetical protein